MTHKRIWERDAEGFRGPLQKKRFEMHFHNITETPVLLTQWNQTAVFRDQVGMRVGTGAEKVAEIITQVFRVGPPEARPLGRSGEFSSKRSFSV